MGNNWKISSIIARFKRNRVTQNHGIPVDGQGQEQGQESAGRSRTIQESNDMATKLSPVITSRKILSPAGPTQEVTPTLEKMAVAWGKYTGYMHVFIFVEGEGETKRFIIYGAEHPTIATHRAMELCAWQVLAPKSLAEVERAAPRVPSEMPGQDEDSIMQIIADLRTESFGKAQGYADRLEEQYHELVKSMKALYEAYVDQIPEIADHMGEFAEHVEVDTG